ncbi:hypothetical protein BV22DRAFT_635313 [Leucogyrophana mollusca]|uniref:Uncharacterized protein n=1 Tax=Leucogyrophana mollusca TaxID=85980 RepID=A0ACB8BAP2_9AGAM|nr:hypothetical protein BV22DRAFT_635313 [Leucogyrophana mollusca]
MMMIPTATTSPSYPTRNLTMSLKHHGLDSARVRRWWKLKLLRTEDPKPSESFQPRKASATLQRTLLRPRGPNQAPRLSSHHQMERGPNQAPRLTHDRQPPPDGKATQPRSSTKQPPPGGKVNKYGKWAPS